MFGATLLGEREPRRTARDLPEIPVRVGEVAAVPTPRRRRRRLHDRPARTFRREEDLLDALPRADVLRERDAAESAPCGGNGRVLRKLLPWVQRQRRGPAAEAEADPVVVLLLDRPAEALVVEPAGSSEVPDAEGDHGDVRAHR